MKKYLLHILIISFVFLLAPTAHVASYAGELEDAKEKVRKYPDEAWAHGLLGATYFLSDKYEEAIKSYSPAYVATCAVGAKRNTNDMIKMCGMYFLICILLIKLIE